MKYLSIIIMIFALASCGDTEETELDDGNDVVPVVEVEGGIDKAEDDKIDDTVSPRETEGGEEGGGYGVPTTQELGRE